MSSTFSLLQRIGKIMFLNIFILLIATALTGTVNCFPEGRVVNGTATDIRKFPFIVSLRRRTSHSCGASIIAPRWILTAAHCVDGRSVEGMTIQYASTEIDSGAENVAAVKRYIVHENYDLNGSIENDIALLELEGSLIFNYKTLAPVTLPEPFFEIPQTQQGAPGVLAGWGLNASAGYVQRHLQEVNLKLYSDNECQSRHNNATTSHQLCGGVDEGGKGQCSGDSGGPLVYNGSVQLGIVSWSIKPCAVYPYPGVYTKVSHYVDWIKNNAVEVV